MRKKGQECMFKEDTGLLRQPVSSLDICNVYLQNCLSKSGLNA